MVTHLLPCTAEGDPKIIANIGEHRCSGATADRVSRLVYDDPPVRASCAAAPGERVQTSAESTMGKVLSHLRQQTPSYLSKSLSHWEAGAELCASSFDIANLSWSPMPLGKEDVKLSNVTKKMRLCVAAVRLNLTNAELRRRSSESICSSVPT